MADIHIDEDALLRAIEPQRQALEAQLTEIMQNTAREVRDEMTGQPADVVYDELTTRLQSRIDDVHLDEAKLRQVAQAIEEGTLED